MSELTERSKCVFQAKLAEQAERYDGASRFILLFFFLFLYTRTTLRENISVKMDPISLPFLFQFVYSLSLFSLSLSRASRSLRADDACTSLFLSLTFFFPHKSSISRFAEMIVALKKLCGIADIELTVRFSCCFWSREREEK